MKKTATFMIALSLASTAFSQNNLSIYKNKAEALYQQLSEKDPSQLEVKSKVLVEISKGIVKANIKALPQCEEYLQALLKDADKIATLPIEDIETGYHADGKLPPLKDGACYHAKDLLVHPATVQAMAKQGIEGDKAWKQAAHEIEEVLEHLSIVEAIAAKSH